MKDGIEPIKIAFDTNVLLDSILNRPERDDALRLMLAISEEKAVGIISANSITDIYYLARKGVGDQAAREAIFDLLSMFDVAPVDGDVCSMALNEPMSDYEAASPVQVRTPASLVRIIEEAAEE